MKTQGPSGGDEEESGNSGSSGQVVIQEIVETVVPRVQETVTKVVIAAVAVQVMIQEIVETVVPRDQMTRTKTKMKLG